MASVIVQPAALQTPNVDDLSTGVVRLPSMTEIRKKITTKEGWIGNYDFSYLCMPTLPWGNNSRRRAAPPFYGLNDPLPITLAIVLGLQHSVSSTSSRVPIFLADSSILWLARNVSRNYHASHYSSVSTRYLR